MDWTQERARQQQELTIQRETLARDQHTLQIATQTLAQKSEFETARLKEEQQQAKRDANVMNNNVMVLEQRRDKVCASRYNILL